MNTKKVIQYFAMVAALSDAKDESAKQNANKVTIFILLEDFRFFK